MSSTNRRPPVVNFENEDSSSSVSEGEAKDMCRSQSSSTFEPQR